MQNICYILSKLGPQGKGRTYQYLATVKHHAIPDPEDGTHGETSRKHSEEPLHSEHIS